MPKKIRVKIRSTESDTCGISKILEALISLFRYDFFNFQLRWALLKPCCKTLKVLLFTLHVQFPPISLNKSVYTDAKLENSKIDKLTIKYLLPLWFPWVWSPRILNKKFAPETKAEREATSSISGCFEVNGVRSLRHSCTYTKTTISFIGSLYFSEFYGN